MKNFASLIFALTLAFTSYAEDEFKWCLYFWNFNSPLKPENEAQFDELAEFIKSYPDSLFEISGHTDARWSPNVSIRLDRKRAAWIRHYLIDNYCIPDSILISVGRGNYEPLIPDAKTEDEHEWNRRVEIKFIHKK